MKKKTGTQAVVLAGGFGTRLSPLTDSRPKPLMSVLDVTILENLVIKLARLGDIKITVSTHYKSEMIERVCERYKDIAVCKRECVPLGTAGGVKFCYDGLSENVLVVSGDAVFDFDLESVLEFHRHNSCDVTIVTSHREDPTEYGIVECLEDGSVSGFLEKPSWKFVSSDRVNTGIYVLSKRAVESIPDRMEYDFSKNLFPKLLREGAKIMAFSASGYWCDIGSFDELYNCNRLAASGRLCVENCSGQKTDCLRKSGIHADDGVYVSQSASVGMNVRINSESVVCRECTVNDNCDICASVIGFKSTVGKGTSISKSIVGEGVMIGENCIIPEGCIIGDGVVLKEGTVLPRYKHIAPFRTVETEEAMGEFSHNTIVFVRDGTVMTDGARKPELLMKLAFAICTAYRRSERERLSVAVMYKGVNSLLKSSFETGLFTAGAECLDMGEGNEEYCLYASNVLPCDLFAFVCFENGHIFVSLFESGARPVSDMSERKILKSYRIVDEDEGFGASPCCKKSAMVPVASMYTSALFCAMKNTVSPDAFSSMETVIRHNSDETAVKAFEMVFRGFGGRITVLPERDALTVRFSGDKSKMLIIDGKAELDKNHMCAVIVKNVQHLGMNEIYLDENMPSVVKNFVPKNVRIKEKRDNILDNFYCDEVVCLLMFLAVVSLRGERIGTLAAELPEFYVYTDEYISDINRAATMERLSRLYNDSKNSEYGGIRLSLAHGNVTVIPNRAKGFRIISEAHSMEAAKELCLKIGKAIKN